MRVLVTRPEPGAARTTARLSRLGHDAVCMPLFETTITAVVGDLPPASRISGFIATSARAFALFGAGNSADRSIFDSPVHVVGPATAQAAREAGFATIDEAGGVARDLARAVIDRHSTADSGDTRTGSEAAQRGLIYLAGVPRTSVIEDALRSARVRFSVLECYKMTEISYSTDILISGILSPPPDVVLLYSAGAVRRLVDLTTAEEVGKTLNKARFACLSQAIAAELPEPWRARAVAADHPDEDSLLASLAALG